MKCEPPWGFAPFITGGKGCFDYEHLMTALVRNEGSKMMGETKKILKKLVCAGNF